MTRRAHHRAIHRVGPHHTWLARKNYHLGKVMSPGRVGLRMARQMVNLRPGVYEIPPCLVLEWKSALEDFRPYATDDTGEVWS